MNERMLGNAKKGSERIPGSQGKERPMSLVNRQEPSGDTMMEENENITKSHGLDSS